MLSVALFMNMLNVIFLSVLMLNVLKLTVFMLSVVMLIVVVPTFPSFYSFYLLFFTAINSDSKQQRIKSYHQGRMVG
jgi:hypothetical protein